MCSGVIFCASTTFGAFHMHDIQSMHTRSATSLSFAYVSNPVLDSSLCRATAPRLCPLQLPLPVCVHFSCCSLIASSSAAACDRRCVCFSCCSPIASASTAAPRLHPLQLQLPDCFHQLFWKIPAHAQYSQTFFVEFEVQ